MARKKGYARKMKKMEPAVMRFQLALPNLTAASPTSSSYIDLSQIASLLNRRFYRQGLNWAVSSIEHLAVSNDGTPVDSGFISVGKLPDTWIMSNAWEKGFRTWQKMNNNAMQEAESVRPRFLDFKIFANSTHHAAGVGANLLPFSITGASAVPGEWEYSKYVVPNAPGGTVNNFEVIATGASYPGGGASGLNAVSLIEGYASSRSLPNVVDPNTPGDLGDVEGATPENWMSALFNEGLTQDDRVLDDLRTENNLAPYPFEDDGINIDTMYPNGANQFTGLHSHDAQYITGTSIGGRTNLAGGMFPCGLMEIQTGINFPDAPPPGPGEEPTTVNQGLWITLVPGNHRGYLCEPMTEM